MTAPNVTIAEIRATLSVARVGSFTNAAIELGISQPGLSRQVQRAEKAYGFDIFDRSVRPMPVTPRGDVVLEAFNEVMNSLARSVEAVNKLA